MSDKGANEMLSQLLGFDPDEVVRQARLEAKTAIAQVLAGYDGDDVWVRRLLAALAAQGVQIAFLATAPDSPVWPKAGIYQAIQQVGIETIGDE